MGGSAATSTSAPTARQCSALRGSPAPTSPARGSVLRREVDDEALVRALYPNGGTTALPGVRSSLGSGMRMTFDRMASRSMRSHERWMKLTRRAIISSARARRRAWSWAGWLAARRACRSPATAAAAPRASRRTASSIWPADDSPLSAARFCSLKQKTRGGIQRHRDNNEMSSGCRS